jgi:hypothetical protein
MNSEICAVSEVNFCLLSQISVKIKACDKCEVKKISRGKCGMVK